MATAGGAAAREKTGDQYGPAVAGVHVTVERRRQLTEISSQLISERHSVAAVRRELNLRGVA